MRSSTKSVLTALIAGVFTPVVYGAGNLSIDSLDTISNTDVVDNLLGIGSVGITVNSVSHVGRNYQIGNFSNALTEMPGVTSFDFGIIMSTGRITDVDGDSITGNNTSVETGNGPNVQTTDPELLTVIPSGTGAFDPAIIQFDFIPDGDFITIEYVFGSDEYPEFVYSDFSDGIGIFIDRDGVSDSTLSFENVAINPAGQVVNINHVNDAANIAPGDRASDTNDDNSGHDSTDGVYESAFPEFYNNNANVGASSLFKTEMDGFSTTFRAVARVTRNATNTLKIGVVDSVDTSHDSWLLISRSSLQIIGADYGDAPDTYGTSNESVLGAATHINTGETFIGPTVDSDQSGSASGGTGSTNGFGGDGIDNSSGAATDDPSDDGVLSSAFDELTIESNSYSVSLQVSNSTQLDANLVGWIDFDGNGAFDPDEAANTSVSPGTNDGTVTLEWTGLGTVTGPDVESGNTYARFRISSNTELDASLAVGAMPDGEVEDYALFIDLDTDGDGIRNSIDIDDDGDRIPDLLEAGVDTDGDGDEDSVDTDSDNDGIPDDIEAQVSIVDTDGDGIYDTFDVEITEGDDLNANGIDDVFETNGTLDSDLDGDPDAIDQDSDDDGIPDALEGTVNTDGVGPADYLDLDSDNDGINDSVEANVSGNDADGDGVDDTFDADFNGAPDVNNNGVDDTLDASGALNSDSDSIADFRDPDSDNDGLPDFIEGTTDTDNDDIPNYLDSDSDEDGIDDSVESMISGDDTDGDGIDDAFDVDETAGIDANFDGIDDDVVLANGDVDSIPNYLDDDSDNDGVPDSIEGFGDTDGDSLPDYLDNDSDNDGISDQIESDVTNSDGDGDGIDDRFDVDVTEGDDLNDNGIDDALEATGGIDSDGDGTPDRTDRDSDNDGVPDIIEGSGDTDSDTLPDFRDTDADNDLIDDGTEASVTGNDTDGDGIDDAFDVHFTLGEDLDNDGLDDAVQPTNTDSDATPDYLDADADNDGVPDVVEGGADTDSDGISDYRDPDSDNDQISDRIEAQLSNSDSDADGIDDRFDIDSTAGVDTNENGVDDAAEASGGQDSDADGVPDIKDPDSDGDGVPDAVEGEGNQDGDVFANYLDTDSDNDGIDDRIEANIIALDTDIDDIVDMFDVTQTGGIDANSNGIDDAFETGSLFDTDEDGIANLLDADSDGDGIPDVVEGRDDADADGLPNYLDADSDNDGISDSIEAGTSGSDADGDGIDNIFDADFTNGSDTNNNGIDDSLEDAIALDSDNDNVPNYQDADSDNDGIPDAVEGVADTDGDNLPDYLDDDSDADGIADGDEAQVSGQDSDGDSIDDTFDADVTGGPDSNGNGIDDNAEQFGSLDSDGDGRPNTIDPDADADGVSDADETNSDNDGDGIPNFIDTDSDNDNISDLIENQGAGQGADSDGDGLVDMLDPDSDNDNVPDVLEGAGDADNDGLPNYLDENSDNDGLADGIEAGAQNSDIDNDGIDDAFDADQTGGNDENNNGVDDAIEASGLPDSDDDGIPNIADSDSDNDTIPDIVENPPVVEEGGTDSTGDTGDTDSQINAIDSDGDGVPDYIDEDSDNDGISDFLEGGNLPTLSGNDADGDGIDDAIDVDVTLGLDADDNGVDDALQPIDSDSDMIPDYLDQDSDNDGVPDVLEGANDIDNDGLANYLDIDSDGDGISDLVEDQFIPTLSGIDSDFDGIDNAIDVNATGGSDANLNGIDDEYEPRDFDQDGVQDSHDLDSDNDGISDEDEGGADSDGDGQPDRQDYDADNDGIPDAIEGTGDTDGDGIADNHDLDSDNDGISDYREAGGIDVDGDARVDNFRDQDGDGQDDTLAVTPLIILNSDADELPDFRDLDSDNDGLSDLLETDGVGNDNDTNGRIDNFVDQNRDGLDDSYAVVLNPPGDFDGDGLFNHQDLDSDGDGYFDLIEGGRIDSNGDGLVDQLLDQDADGIPDSVDVSFTGGSDVDGDGIDDSADASVQLGDDSDGDGIIDSRDPDANGDGVADAALSGEPALSAALPDLDGNGIADVLDANGGIVTGLSGTGCSIDRGSSKPDFILLIMAMIALSVLIVKRRFSWSGLRLLAFVSAVLLSTSAGAQSSSGERKRMYYGTFGLGVSQLGPDASRVPVADLQNESPTAAQISFGLDMREQYSLEFHAAELGEADFGVAGQIGYQTFGLSAIGYLGRNRSNVARRGFTAFGRAGIGYMNNSASGVARWSNKNANHLLLGAGLEYMGRKGFGVRAEYIGFDADAKYAQLAMIYRLKSREKQVHVLVKNQTPVPSGQVTDTKIAQIKRTQAQRDGVAKQLKSASPAASIGNTTTTDNARTVIATPVQAISTVALDRDKDGVVDSRDRCPQSRVGGQVNTDGCTIYTGVLGGVNFYSGSSALTPEAEQVLTGVVQDLAPYPTSKIAVAAHTDNVGDAKANRKLSQQRAIAVLRFLVSQGITKARLSGKAFGDVAPIASNNTEAGRDKNRRVEINVMY